MTSSVPGESGVERREWSGESWREWKGVERVERVGESGKSWRKKREKKGFGSAHGFPTVLHSALSSLFH